MTNVVVANPKAAAGRVRAWWESHRAGIERRLGEVEVRLTSAPGHATQITRDAIRAGCERIIAVGGDGTVNEVVNGFFADGAPIRDDVTLFVFPGGTGGDFARSIGMSGIDIMEALDTMEPRRVDAGRATLTRTDGSKALFYFINISSFGSSGLIVDKVNKSTKLFGGKASFFIGALKGLVEYRNQRVRLRIDDDYEEEHVINTVAVANGRYFGGSMMVAPNAVLDDGSFDVVIIGDVGLAAFVRHQGEIYKGTHLKRPWISVMRGKIVEAWPLGPEPVLIDLDGEQPGCLPVRYEMIPGAITLLAPWKSAEAVNP